MSGFRGGGRESRGGGRGGGGRGINHLTTYNISSTKLN